MKIKTILLLSSISLTLSSCFIEQPAKKPPRELVKIDIDIFAARGFLGGSDYEHYTLKDGLLWRECGSIPLKKGNPENGAANKTLQVRQKRLENLKAEEQAPIVEAYFIVRNEMDKAAISALPAPQSVKSMSDGGLFELKSSKLDLATTVDAVSDEKTKEAGKLRNLFERIRGVGPIICDAQTFFNIGRK